MRFKVKYSIIILVLTSLFCLTGCGGGGGGGGGGGSSGGGGGGSSGGGGGSGNRTTVANNIATAFDSNNPSFKSQGIYSTTRTYFGSEWKPGIDDDSKVFILISPKLGRSGLYGYFYSLDETTGYGSNQKEIIYTNDNLWAGNMYNGLATVAHEFQHLINYNEKYRGGGSFEDDTINEGQSMLSEYLNGFTMSEGGSHSGNGYMIRAVRGFINTPHNFSFFSWNGGYDYGAAYLFMLYIYERFGAGVIQSIAQSSSVSSSNIAACTGVSFASLFKDWCLINYYDGLTGAPSQYSGVNLVGAYTGYSGYDNSTTSNYTLSGIAFGATILTYPSAWNVSFSNWSPVYINFTTTQTRNLSIDFQADTKYNIYSNFILESPIGAYNSTQGGLDNQTYTANSFSSSKQGVLIAASTQSTYTLPQYILNVTGPVARSEELFKTLKQIECLHKSSQDFKESKDLPLYIQKYGEYVNKTERVNPLKLKETKAYSVGQQETFYILENGTTLTTCTAKCYAAGTNCYVFIDTASTDITE